MGFHQRFLPDMRAPRITAIPLAVLKEKGIRALLVDVDNTITAWRSPDLTDEVRQWFASLPEEGFSACIVSNSDDDRVRPIAQTLGIDYIHRARKPFADGYERAMRKLGVTVDEAAMVGDQLLTDIYGGNRAGMFTICLDIIDPHEFWGTHHFARRIERLIRRHEIGDSQ